MYQNTTADDAAAAAWKEILWLLTNTHKNYCTLQQLLFFIISRMNGHQPFHDEKKKLRETKEALSWGTTLSFIVQRSFLFSLMYFFL